MTKKNNGDKIRDWGIEHVLMGIALFCITGVIGFLAFFFTSLYPQTEARIDVLDSRVHYQRELTLQHFKSISDNVKDIKIMQKTIEHRIIDHFVDHK